MQPVALFLVLCLSSTAVEAAEKSDTRKQAVEIYKQWFSVYLPRITVNNTAVPEDLKKLLIETGAKLLPLIKEIEKSDSRPRNIIMHEISLEAIPLNLHDKVIAAYHDDLRGQSLVHMSKISSAFQDYFRKNRRPPDSLAKLKKHPGIYRAYFYTPEAKDYKGRETDYLYFPPNIATEDTRRKPEAMKYVLVCDKIENHNRKWIGVLFLSGRYVEINLNNARPFFPDRFDYLNEVLTLDVLCGNSMPSQSLARTAQQKKNMGDDPGERVNVSMKKPCVSKVNSVGMTLILIESGSFTMGHNSKANEQILIGALEHEVAITKPFYVGSHEVTQAQWQVVMGKNPSRVKVEMRPVTHVSYEDCQQFLKKLSVKEGKKYRLLTEAEWEYVCRAGTTGPYGGTGKLGEMGWYKDNSENSIHPVGQKKPNAWHVYDMHGNVSEWCVDWYSRDYYKNSPGKDPLGPLKGKYRVYRGGSFNSDSLICYSACRFDCYPDFKSENIGFRVCLPADQVEDATGTGITEKP